MILLSIFIHINYLKILKDEKIKFDNLIETFPYYILSLYYFWWF
jgi:hypothetical protein